MFLVAAYMYATGKLEIFILSYVFIVLHELSHVIVAKLLNVDVYEIEMLPIGINAKYNGTIPTKKELIISLAGPCASLLFYVLSQNTLLQNINLFIALTNLIPFKPYDGGRILNSLITIVLGNEIAFKITNSIQKISLKLLLIMMFFSILKLKNYYLGIACIYMICIVKEELKNERFNDLIKYLQIE